jgi:hypothetical protein
VNSNMALEVTVEAENRPKWEKWVYRLCIAMQFYPFLLVSTIALSAVEFLISERRMPIPMRDDPKFYDLPIFLISIQLISLGDFLLGLTVICLSICIWIDLRQGARWWKPVAIFWSGIALLAAFVAADPWSIFTWWLD